MLLSIAVVREPRARGREDRGTLELIVCNAGTALDAAKQACQAAEL